MGPHGSWPVVDDGSLCCPRASEGTFISYPAMAWFFLAILIFPVLFTPGFYVDLPSWLPITVSYVGLALGLESYVRLLNILFISLVLVRTTSSEDWMSGLDKLLGL